MNIADIIALLGPTIQAAQAIAILIEEMNTSGAATATPEQLAALQTVHNARTSAEATFQALLNDSI